MTTNPIELFTSEIDLLETMDDSSVNPKARIRIKIINEGSNNKNLRWTEQTMRKVAHMFRGVPFRYDLTGQNEGSHTRERISSPFYDVGWTYSDERGAYYDNARKCVVVEGEVTHPDVVAKLKRQTSDGKREINFASMGAMIRPEDTECSVCGSAPFGSCSHKRGEKYGMEMCDMIPKNVSKALHVALTNDPADKNAVIESAIFQDMNSSIGESFGVAAHNAVDEKSPVSVSTSPNMPGTPNMGDIKALIKEVLEEMMKSKEEPKMKKEEDKKIEVAESMESKEELDEKKKKKKEESKESKEEEKEEDSKKEKMVVQESDKKDSESEEDEDEEEKPKKKKKKEEQIEKGEKVEKEHSKTIEKIKKEDMDVDDATEEIAKDHVKEDPKYYDKLKRMESADDSSNEKTGTFLDQVDNNDEFKIKSPIRAPENKPVAVMQDSSVKEVKVDYADKYKAKLISELADSYVKVGKSSSKQSAMDMLSSKSIEQLEIYQDALDGVVVEEKKFKSGITLQDNNIQSTKKFVDTVPEFGGTIQHKDPYVEVQDMSPSERAKTFGDYGKFDLCFNPHNANKYRKTK